MLTVVEFETLCVGVPLERLVVLTMESLILLADNPLKALVLNATEVFKYDVEILGAIDVAMVDQLTLWVDALLKIIDVVVTDEFKTLLDDGALPMVTVLLVLVGVTSLVVITTDALEVLYARVLLGSALEVSRTDEFVALLVGERLRVPLVIIE